VAHISTGVEYALHCLLYLAEPASAAPAGARDLAQLQGIPAEYVAKVFTRLEKARLVIASEGLRGGFRLARPAAAISVLDVIDAIDGEKPLFDCREIRGSCALVTRTAWKPRGTCAIHAVMLEAEARMREALAAHSLADLAARVAAKLPAGFGDEVADWLATRAAARAANRRTPATKVKS
jgi:Rrf2 family protein